MPDWDDASCTQVDPDLFFLPENDDNYLMLGEVRRICSACPLRDACLQVALDQNIRYEIWGGMTPGQRRRLRRAA